MLTTSQTQKQLRTIYRRSEHRGLVTPTASFSIIATVALFLVLPLANLIKDRNSETRKLAQVESAIPPPPAPPEDLPPDPEPENETPEPELVQDPPPLTLAQLEMTLNSGMGVVAGSGFANFDANFDAIAEIKLFEIADLDKIPVALSTVQPVHPFDLKKSGVEGTATVMFVVDDEGNIRDAKAIDSTHHEFGAATISAVKNWKFQPGMKDGSPVNTIVRQRVAFTL